jgi:hypothetical protein
MTRNTSARSPLRHVIAAKTPAPAGMSRHERERRIEAVKAALARVRVHLPRRPA